MSINVLDWMRRCVDFQAATDKPPDQPLDEHATDKPLECFFFSAASPALESHVKPAPENCQERRIGPDTAAWMHSAHRQSWMVPGEEGC